MSENETPTLPETSDFCECEVEQLCKRVVCCPKCHAIWFIGTKGTLEKREPHMLQGDNQYADH